MSVQPALVSPLTLEDKSSNQQQKQSLRIKYALGHATASAHLESGACGMKTSMLRGSYAATIRY